MESKLASNVDAASDATRIGPAVEDGPEVKMCCFGPDGSTVDWIVDYGLVAGVSWAVLSGISQ